MPFITEEIYISIMLYSSESNHMNLGATPSMIKVVGITITNVDDIPTCLASTGQLLHQLW